MSARVFVHPRCLTGPALAALEAALIERGYDTEVVRIGPPSVKGHCELVQLVDVANDGTLTLKRFDGVQFEHRTNQPKEAA